MLDFNDLTAKLADIGFQLKRRTRNDWDFRTKPGNGGVFSEVTVTHQGRKKDAVYATIGLSLTRWIPRDPSDERILTEIAGIPERGWSLIHTAAEATQWEAKLVNLLPSAIETFAHEHATALLDRTVSFRDAANSVLAGLSKSISFVEQISGFERCYGNEFVREASRIAHFPWVMEVSNCEAAYTLAICAVLAAGGGGFSFGMNPLHSEPLMWQIQLVTDELLTWGNDHDLA